MQKQYNATKYNQLNEVPVPIINDPTINEEAYKKHMEISNSIYDNNQLDNVAFAKREKPIRKKYKKNYNQNLPNDTQNDERRKKKRKNDVNLDELKSLNATGDSQGKHKKRGKDFNGMKWKSYYDRATISPLHPRRIIQEFTY